MIVLTAVSERWLKDLKPWQAVIAADTLVQLGQERLSEIFATLERGELPAEEWKSNLAKLVPEAHERIPAEEP